MKKLSKKDAAFIYNNLFSKAVKYRNLLYSLLVHHIQYDNDGILTKETLINLFFKLDEICKKDSNFNKALDSVLLSFETRKDAKIEKKKKLRGIKKVRNGNK